jgi:hypothetical protein
MTILRGKAAQVDLTLEEGTLFDPVFHNLVDGAVDQDGDHEAFPADSVAYFTAMTEQNGETLFELGPYPDDTDGTCELDAAGGIIECVLPPTASIAMPVGEPVSATFTGWYNLVIYPGGDETQAIRYAEGKLVITRRSINRPAAV